MARSKLLIFAPPVLMGNRDIPWYLSGGIAAASCIGAYKAIGVADYAASKVNIVNPGTYDLAASSGPLNPTWDTVTGWTFNGSTQFLGATGLTLAEGAARTWTMIARFSGCTGDTGYMMGYTDGAGNYWCMTPRRSGVSKFLNGGGAGALSSTAASSGVIALAGATGYMDGVALGTCTLGSSSGPDFHVGCLHGPSLYYAGSVQMFAIYNTVLTLSQVEAVTAAMSFF